VTFNFQLWQVYAANVTYVKCRAGKNLRFLEKVFWFLGFNIYAQSHAEHWTQEHDQLKSYMAARAGVELECSSA